MWFESENIFLLSTTEATTKALVSLIPLLLWWWDSLVLVVVWRQLLPGMEIDRNTSRRNLCWRLVAFAPSGSGLNGLYVLYVAAKTGGSTVIASHYQTSFPVLLFPVILPLSTNPASENVVVLSEEFSRCQSPVDEGGHVALATSRVLSLPSLVPQVKPRQLHFDWHLLNIHWLFMTRFIRKLITCWALWHANNTYCIYTV